MELKKFVLFSNLPAARMSDHVTLNLTPLDKSPVSYRVELMILNILLFISLVSLKQNDF